MFCVRTLDVLGYRETPLFFVYPLCRIGFFSVAVVICWADAAKLATRCAAAPLACTDVASLRSSAPRYPVTAPSPDTPNILELFILISSLLSYIHDNCNPRLGVFAARFNLNPLPSFVILSEPRCFGPSCKMSLSIPVLFDFVRLCTELIPFRLHV